MHSHYLRNLKGHLAHRLKKPMIFLKSENNRLFVHIYFENGKQFHTAYRHFDDLINTGTNSEMMAKIILADFKDELEKPYFW